MKLSTARMAGVITLMAILAIQAGAEPTARGALPATRLYANQVLPDTVQLVDQMMHVVGLARKPEFLSITTGKDEYVYHLSDHVFIRCVKDRYELPAWRICGDFAIVRVELMDESMRTSGPVMAWHMVYRDQRWQRLADDGQGHFSYSENGRDIELPPYAARCFNLDKRELLDQ